MSEYTENDLEGLTPEEIEALKDDDGSGDKTTLGESVKDDKAGSGTEANTDDAAAAANAEAEAAAAAAQKEKDDAAAAAAAAGEGDDPANTDDTAAAAAKPATQPQQPIVPLLVAEAPADADARLKDISDKKVTLLDQFDNGDITAKEYQTQLDALNKDERAIERAVEKAQTAAEMRQQQEKAAWGNEVKDFTLKEHPEYSTSKSRWIALDAYVKEIANDPASAQLSGPQILAKAHELVVADLGEVAGKKDADPAAKTGDGKKADDKTGKPLKGAEVKPPKTLRDVPAAENSNLVDNSKFAALDRLGAEDPLALEEKLFKMSAADRDEYLASRP